MKKINLLFVAILLSVISASAVNYTLSLKSEGCADYSTFSVPSGSTISIDAIPDAGYAFKQWDDGNTDNPRTVTVTDNKTYTAYFDIGYTITAKNRGMGTVSGGGTYLYNTTATLTATPEDGCVFKQWDDGNTDNPRTITVTGNKTYTAIFEYVITVQSNNITMGTVSGGGVYLCNTTAILTATPKEGYAFKQWDDGNMDNPRRVRVGSNATYTAIFRGADTLAVNQSCTKGVKLESIGDDRVFSENAIWPYYGVAIGGTYYEYGGYATVEGITNANKLTITYTGDIYQVRLQGAEGAEGVGWFNPDQSMHFSTVDGSEIVREGNNTTISVNLVTCGLAGVTAFYVQSGDAAATGTVTISSMVFSRENINPLTVGVKTDGCDLYEFQYEYGDYVVLTAIPEDGYAFKQWDDGNTDNPRTVTVTGNKTYTATFVATYTITVNSANATMGTVSGGGTYIDNSTATLTATPKEGYAFKQWNDGNTDNPRTVTVTGDVAYTAEFAPILHTITVKSNNAEMGTVSGGGTYNYGTTATLHAEAQMGYEFVRWNDGNIDNPRMVKIMQDTVFAATFRAKPIVTVAPNNAEMGSVSGGGTYATGSTASLTATPNEGYEFVRWSDNGAVNPRTVTVIGDAAYTAVFAAKWYNISIITNADNMGDVAGSGAYEYNKVATLLAMPSAGNHFVQWSDGSTENPHYVKVLGDKMYIATFATGASASEARGETATNDGVAVTPFETKAEFTWPSITGVASYSLVIWADEAQGKKVCTLTFNANGQLTNIDFTQSVKPQGSASVGGLNFTVTGLKPSTTYGYTLDAKDAEDEVIETKHGTFTTMGASGIADITAAGINIYTEGRTIIVENAAEAITVSDALGRVVGKDDAQIVPAETRKFPVPSSGVYVVKIGNRAASVLVR